MTRLALGRVQASRGRHSRPVLRQRTLHVLESPMERSPHMSTLSQEHRSDCPDRRWGGQAMRSRLVARATPFLVAAMLALMAGWAIAEARTEVTMGHAQRVLYVHVAVAWLSLAGFLAVAATGLLYLLTRRLAHDRWAQASAEVGWLSSWLTLATGSLWAHSAWGTWWTWEPRLMSTFVLWALYGGVLLVRAGIADAHARARIGALLTILGALDVPLVIMATRWFRTLHPVSPELEPSMRVALSMSVVAFSAFAFALVRCRRSQLEVHDVLLRLETADAG